MPAYDRYWDLHITADLYYDWPEELVQTCIYQRETKKSNGIKGKALMVLPFLGGSRGHLAAVACLNSIKTSEVVFRTSREEFLAALREAGSMLKRRSIVNNVTGTVAKVYKMKFAAENIEVLDTEPINFQGIILSSTGQFDETAISLANAPLKADREVMTIYSEPSRRPSLDELDKNGVKYGLVSTAIPMGDIANAKKDEFTRQLVTWILSAGASKIRITCHGDGEGNLEMNPKAIQSISADSIGKWLHANGLTERKNLQTISLNICMGAKGNLTPAVIRNGQYSPAEGSAVQLLAASLSSLNVHGVRVTGSNEIITSVEDDPTIERTAFGTPLLNSQTVRRIQIPAGFAFDRATLILTVPQDWTLEGRRLGESQLFAIRSPADWTVEKEKSGIVRTHEVASSSYFFKSPKGTLCTIPSDGWIVSGKEALSAEGWVAAGPGKIQFRGTGGAFALEVQSGSTVRIVERLAKSKAKAVAVS